MPAGGTTRKKRDRRERTGENPATRQMAGAGEKRCQCEIEPCCIVQAFEGDFGEGRAVVWGRAAVARCCDAAGVGQRWEGGDGSLGRSNSTGTKKAERTGRETELQHRS